MTIMTGVATSPEHFQQMAEMSQQFHNAFANQQAQFDEAIGDLALRIDEIGWNPLNDFEDNGISLDALKKASDTLQDMVSTNPIMKRAAQLRHGYVFGRGMLFSDVKPAAQKIMDKRYNKRALFCVTAWEELNRAKFTDGNVFVLRDHKTEEYFRIPLKEITGAVTDPQSAERVRFLQRTYTEYNQASQNDPGKKVVVWYKVYGYDEPERGRPTKIGEHSIDRAKTMYFEPANRLVGHTWGIPDGYAAMVWVIAYSEYLKNNSKLVKAYAQIAYKASNKTQAGGQQTSASLAVPGGVAGTAVMGQAQDLVPMPRAGSDVSFENGRPLAAMVAASLGVSVVALLSDPGAAGSSYGSAQTLDAPTIIVMASLQEGWKMFFEDVLDDIKSPKAKIEFPAIENDPVYRQIESLTQVFLNGGINQEEYRAAVLDLMDIKPLGEGLPKPNDFNNGGANKAARTSATKAAGGETNNDGRTDTLTTGDAASNA